MTRCEFTDLFVDQCDHCRATGLEVICLLPHGYEIDGEMFSTSDPCPACGAAL